MTPAQIETAARERYNATSDTFFTQSEIMNLIYAAETHLATETQCISAKTTTASIASTRVYNFPTNAISIKRLEYDGQKLQPVTFREDDALTLNATNTNDLGRPSFYSTWNNQVYLRATPDTSGLDLTFYTFNMPTIPTASSTLEVPVEYHMDMVYFILSSMTAKDQNLELSTYYAKLWQDAVMRAKKFERTRQVGDSFKAVQDMRVLQESIIGTV